MPPAPDEEPIPQNTGTSATETIACVIIGCGTKGYTAIMASALLLRIVATSVVNMNERRIRPFIRIPLAFPIASGKPIMFFLRCPRTSGMYISFI